MESAYRHCAQLVRAADADRFLATLFAPADKRDALFALYAFNCEIANVRERARAPMPGEIRLQWWREVVDGERVGEAAANPVASALLDTVGRFALSTDQLIDLVDAHAFDLYDDPMPSIDVLEAYMRRTFATIFDFATAICGARAQHASERAGLAYGTATLLRSFALHASRHQFFIPIQLLENGAIPEDAFAGRASPGLVSALAMLRTRARDDLSAFEQMLSRVPSAAMPALLPVALVSGYLALMDRPDYDPFRTPVEVPQWRRQWTLWRAARRYTRIMRG